MAEHQRDRLAPLTVLIDESRSTYLAYALSRGTVWDVWGPKIWRSTHGSCAAVDACNDHADILQLRGDFVIDHCRRIATHLRSADPTTAQPSTPSSPPSNRPRQPQTLARPCTRPLGLAALARPHRAGAWYGPNSAVTTSALFASPVAVLTCLLLLAPHAVTYPVVRDERELVVRRRLVLVSFDLRGRACANPTPSLTQRSSAFVVGLRCRRTQPVMGRPVKSNGSAPLRFNASSKASRSYSHDEIVVHDADRHVAVNGDTPPTRTSAAPWRRPSHSTARELAPRDPRHKPSRHPPAIRFADGLRFCSPIPTMRGPPWSPKILPERSPRLAPSSPVKTDQLEDQTPCKSWKVRDLVNHIVGGRRALVPVRPRSAKPRHLLIGTGRKGTWSRRSMKASPARSRRSLRPVHRRG